MSLEQFAPYHPSTPSRKNKDHSPESGDEAETQLTPSAQLLSHAIAAQTARRPHG